MIWEVQPSQYFGAGFFEICYAVDLYVCSQPDNLQTSEKLPLCQYYQSWA